MDAADVQILSGKYANVCMKNCLVGLREIGEN